eukprot:TRINITY_DN1078_c0_g1_i3.p1 TRINITY_DN1078_c0_g1~~TRINITY_DN1078_c0_g1_i3.p1  ORF type:complete len:240 (-),score=91.46 TRINITY_DN1078_c0_g1_i3:92-811(-)
MRPPPFILLQEMFNCPYSNDSFGPYSESAVDGPTAKFLSEQAKQHGIYLIGGSIPEKEGDKLYNTSLSYGPKGDLLAKHRKMHLFDIDIPGKIFFKESETLTAGDTFAVLETEYCNIGIGICYDLRFPELSTHLAHKKGCKILCFPGAFNLTTGPMHWELLLRARAVDLQVFSIGVSPARSEAEGYKAWGHSTIVDPWGKILATTEHSPDVIIAEIDVNKVDEMREQIPTLKQKRHDLY